MVIVRIINIISIAKNVLNLCFSYINNSDSNSDSKNFIKTQKKKLVFDGLNQNEFIEVNFTDSNIEIEDIDYVKDKINIYIELNENRLINSKNKQDYYFVLNLNEIILQTSFILKIEDIFIISFNVDYTDLSINNNDNLNYDRLEKLDSNILDESLASVDSNLEEEIYINKEEKKKELNKVEAFFGRLNFFSFDELFRKRRNSLSREESDKNKILIIEKKSTSNNLGEYINKIEVLTTIDYATYLKEQSEENTKNNINIVRETFCSGFFISSFPEKNASILEKSEYFPAPCGHNPCSKLKSLKPEILMRYPLEDSDEIEINNNASTLCFPSGIKLCHCENENKPNKMEDYLTLITNKKGERLYIMTYHFYLRVNKKDFDQKYEKYPLKVKLKELEEKMKGMDFSKIDAPTMKTFEELKICKEFEFRPYVYVPYCLALISKYPYITQMKESIISIFKIIESQIQDNNLELNELLMYLIHSIPIPSGNTFIKFPLPYNNALKKNIIIESPKFQDVNTLNSNICELLKIFRIKNIIKIFRLLIFEKKIVFIDSNYSRLTDVMNSFLSLLYPFRWVNVYVPIMSIQMIQYLETFLPFLVGVHSSFIPHIKKLIINNSNEKEQVYLIYIEEDKIRIGDFLKGDKKNRIEKSAFMHKNLISLPFWMNTLLNHLLSDIHSKMRNVKYKKANEFNFEIQKAFIEIFVEMFEDYNKYIYQVGDETIFNKQLFMTKKNFLEKNFYNEFLATQMFLQFKQDILGDGFEYFKSKVKERNSGYNKDIMGKTALEKTRASINVDSQKKMYVINHQFNNIIQFKKKSGFGNSNTKENYIINDLKPIDKEKFDFSKCTLYLLPLSDALSMIRKNTSAPLAQTQKSDSGDKKVKTDEEKLKEFQIYKMQEQIKEFIYKIFKSDVSTKTEEFKHILSFLTNDEKSRQYFIKLISKNLSKVVILSKNSFDSLYHLVFETLLIIVIKIEISDEIFKDAVLIVKSTMNYGKEEKNKIITIWDLCKAKLKESCLIYEQSFWNEWYLMEINNNNKVVDKQLLNDDVKAKIVISIAKIMKELKIDLTVISYYTSKILKKCFENNTELQTKTEKEILNIIYK